AVDDDLVERDDLVAVGVGEAPQPRRPVPVERV
ncbi:MAG: hypothetical protein AVDCRST_MAG38-2053, partial [uncultured Solirubrobacteraceae bacterium]